ncbi:MAG: hypothetical protein WBA74_03955 [Cyclobacteriaceae bacterium]
MKTLFTNIFHLKIILLVGLTITLYSCNSEQDSKAVTTVVEGNIENPGDYLIEFVVNDSTYIVDLDENNNFRFETTALRAPSEVQFIHGKEAGYIYLEPGTRLKMDIDHNTLYETASFTGPLAPQTRYLFQIATVERSSPDQTALFRMKEDEFLQKIETIKNKKLEQAQKFDQEISDSSFLVTGKGNIYYEWANRLISYQNMHAMLNKDYTFEVSDSLKALIADIPLERPELINSYRYINFLFDKVSKQVNESMAAVTIAKDQVHEVMLEKSVETSRQMIDNEEIENRLIREFILYYYPDLNEQTRNKVLKDYEYLIDEQFANQLQLTLKSNT